MKTLKQTLSNIKANKSLSEEQKNKMWRVVERFYKRANPKSWEKEVQEKLL